MAKESFRKSSVPLAVSKGSFPAGTVFFVSERCAPVTRAESRDELMPRGLDPTGLYPSHEHCGWKGEPAPAPGSGAGYARKVYLTNGSA